VLKKTNNDIEERFQIAIKELDLVKSKFEECKQIIVRNNYKIIYDEEMDILNSSLIKNKEFNNNKSN
jgi:hypothetical protein